MNTSLKKVIALVMVFAVTLTTAFATNPIATQAATKKAVTKLKVAKSSVSVNEGKTVTVKVTVKGKKGASKKFSVKTSNKSVATAKVAGASVKIAGKSAGTAVITITTKGKNKKGKKLSKKIKVTVVGNTKPEETTAPTETSTVKPGDVAATGLTLEADKTVIQIGSPAIITATVAPADTTDKTVTYTSSNTAVATVDAKTGVVLGIAVGTAVITGTTVNGITKSIAIEVKPVSVTGITLDQTEAEIAIPGTLSLKASVIPENASNQKITWVSQDQKIATVDEVGRVTAVAEGTTVITATTADGNHTATCKITVKKERVVADGISVEVTNATEINGKKYDNTQLVGHDMTFLVTVGKNGQPVVGDNIQVVPTPISGNMSRFYQVRENSIKTDENGHATFTLGLNSQYANLTAVEGFFQSFGITVKESDSSLTSKTTVKFASVQLNGIDVLRQEPYKTVIAPGQNAAKTDTGLFATDSLNGAQTQMYVNSQQVSSTDQDHKVYMSATPYLLLPATVESEERGKWSYEVPEGKQGGKCSVYNDQTNTETSVIVSNIPAGLENVTLEFDKFELSKYTTMKVIVYNKVGEIIDATHVYTNANNGTANVQLGNLSQDGECYLVVSLISQGQVDTASAGYALKKITGSYASQAVEQAEMVEIENAVKWSDISSEAIKQTQIMGELSYAQASNLIPADSKFLNKDYTYKYQVPSFPISGNAILTVSDKNGVEKAYFSFPTTNVKNVNQLASTTQKKAIQITTDEKNNTAGSMTTEGNIAIMDSKTTGMQFLKATIDIDALSSDELNFRNGAELYSFIHWAPLPNKEEEKIANPKYFAIEGQDITLIAQLVDQNMNPQASEGKLLKVTYGSEKIPINLAQSNEEIGQGVTCEATNKGATNQDGRVTLKFRGVTKDRVCACLKDLVVKADNYDVALSLVAQDNSTTTLPNKAIDLFWVDLGLTYVNSAVETDIRKRITNFAEEGVSISPSSSYIVSDTNGWQIGYLPVARSEKFDYSNDDRVDRSNVKTQNEFVGISGVTVTYEKSGDMSLDTSNEGVAIINSTVAGTFRLTGQLSVPDPTKVTFTYYDENGTLVTAKNVGINTTLAIAGTRLTLATVWRADGMNVDIIAPRLVCETETANVYVKITDNYGNPLTGKDVKYTITRVNKTEDKVSATEKKNGVYLIELPKPEVKTTGDCTISVYVTDISSGQANITYMKEPTSAFTLAKSKTFKVSEDGKTVEVFFSNAIEESSISEKMFKLVNPNDNSEIVAESAVKNDANSIVITLNKAIPDLSIAYNFKISAAKDGDVQTWLSDNSGQFIKTASKSFVPADYVK